MPFLILIILVLSGYYVFLFNQRFHRSICLLISYYPTILVIMLVAPVTFFTSHHFAFIHLHSLHDNILHHPSLIRYFGYHPLLIRLILVFLLQKILLIRHPPLPHQIFSVALNLKFLYSEILMIPLPARPLLLILFIQLQNHLIFLVLILLMDGSESSLKMIIT